MADGTRRYEAEIHDSIIYIVDNQNETVGGASRIVAQTHNGNDAVTIVRSLNKTEV